MKLAIPAGSTSRMFHIFVQDSTVTTGAGKTGLTNASVTAYYKRQGASSATSITLTGTGTLGTYTSGLFKEVDATNMPGVYEFHPPDAALAASANHVAIMLKGTGIVPVLIEIQLDYAFVTSALTALQLDKLLTAAVTGSNVTDNSIFAKLVSSSATADWDDFVNTTDALQAIRDHGDTAWIGETGPDEAAIWAYATRTITGGTVSTVDASAITATSFDTGAIDDDALAADNDVYQARVYLFDDDTGTTDRYVAIWHKNGAPVTSGITSPLIQVYAVANGADLIASTAMTQIASTGTYRYNATGAERTTAGAAYIAKVTATIDGSARTTYVPVGRDT